ncbi:zinc-dependent alcohol dehydrogenase family protein [Anaeromyxobacter sp. PSR-1]|uniref:zinc-dependent alcohol dehydrogenase family protein n=1 Tax=Anaeromyxobacter sp. PSR-1 TaxID=1300915 RepID=UPI0005EA35E7|nr:zinc-dependent alcohol dehydrogenase family protein [Anaeromyxobacter sp. PSR-1]GAO03689.1 quinone oxidoreductase-like protein At1g23740, chloroplastic [Anaeromyxobacter sp. PSR-1]
MRAIVLSRFGGPEVLELREVPDPSPGPGELLVRVIASGTNPVDAKLRHDGRWAGLAPPVVIGYDASGVVEAVGPGVKGFAPGDEVYYTPEIFGNAVGSYAERNTVAAAIVARKPARLTHAQAAAIPLAGGTAYEAVVRRLQVRPGESLLVQGGAGGVGSFAVQLGKACGARVIATAGKANQATLRALGADVCLDYDRDDVADAIREETGGAGVDAVFSTVGGAPLLSALPLTRPFGRLATILEATGDLTPLYVRNLTLHGVFLAREGARLRELARLVDQGKLEPLVDAVLPLEQVAEAHRRLDSGHGRGKIVLEVGR